MAAARAMVVAPVPAPKKGVKPHLEGVPGKLTVAPSVALKWGARKGLSPYDALLEQLAAAKPGQVLAFEHPRAKPSVGARSRKLGLRVEMAELDGKLYVRFAGFAPDSDRYKKLLRDKLLAAVAEQERNEVQLAVELRKQPGMADVDAGTIHAVLCQMEQGKMVQRMRDGSWKPFGE